MSDEKKCYYCKTTDDYIRLQEKYEHLEGRHEAVLEESLGYEKKIEELENKVAELEKRLENVIAPKFKMYQEVYFIDYFDTDTNCSKACDGSSREHNVIMKIRQATIDTISQLSREYIIYRIFVKEWTEEEEEMANKKSLWMEKSFNADELFTTKTEAEQKLAEMKNE